MNIKANVNFHNKFIIEVRDKDTNELKKTGMAENIVLDRAYTQVCNFSSYFNLIHFGTGTGVTVPTRTTLFTPLGYKTAIDEKKTKAYPISSVTRRIRLEPEEYVGSTITEVGISETSSAINTHALIRDAEGNPLSITKTALDVVIIYATVFVELQNPSNSFKFINFPNNDLVNYFLDNATPSANITCDSNPDYTNNSTPMLVSKAGLVTVDLLNRKRKYKTRFGVDDGNGAIRSNRLESSLKVVYPETNSFTGHNLAGVTIGTGDGVKREFEIPHIRPENIVLKVNGVATTSYELFVKPFVEHKLQDLGGVPFYGRDVAIYGDTIVAAAEYNPSVTVHKLNPASCLYGYRQDLTGLGSGRGRAAAFNGDTIVAVVSEQYWPTVTTATVHKLNPVSGLYNNIQTLPGVGTYGWGVAINGDTIAIATDGTPYFPVYKLNPVSNLYEKLQNLTEVGEGGKGVAIYGDTIFAVSAGAPYFTVHKLNPVSGLYEKTQDLTGVGANGSRVAMYSDTIVTSSENEPYFTVHKLNPVSGLYEKTQDLTGVGVGGNGVAINGDTIVTVSSSAPLCTIHKLHPVSGLYEKVQDVTVNGGTAVAFDGETVAVMKTSSDYIDCAVYKLYHSKKAVIFDTPPEAGTTITADYSVDYIPKSTDYVLDVEFELTFREGV